MVWKESGKYGVNTGRTVRNPFSRFCNETAWIRSAPGRESELLLKFTRGTQNMSSREMEQFLSENDINDGLGDFKYSSTRQLRAGSSVHLSSVPHSLKKRKRWTLPELAEENIDGGPTDASARPSVTFVHRRMRKKVDADCIAIQKVKENKVFTPRKRKYTRVQDLLKKCDETELEPEIGYEMSYRYPRNEYPECGEGRTTYYRWSFQYSLKNPRKSRCKNKGVKNKGHRWGLYSDSELRDEETTKKEQSETYSSHRATESKVSIIDARLLSNWKASQKTSCSRSTGFALGSYIDELSRHPTISKKRQQRASVGHSQNGSPDRCFKYGKKSVLFIDTEPCMDTQNPTTVNTIPSASVPPVLPQPETKVAVMLPVEVDDVKPGKLKADWNGLYTEGSSLPRKFTIDLVPLLSADGTFTNETCYLLFEVTKKVKNEVNCATTDVSLHITKTEGLSSNFDDAIAKFYLEMESGKKDLWRISDIVGNAILCLQNCYQSSQSSTSDSQNHKKTWRSVEVLGSMFGWKSEIYTEMEIKSELRAKIKKEGLLSMNDLQICNETDDVKTVDQLDKFCGICYEELGNQSSVPFTALKHCHHAFCNECWEVHLKMQISLGNTVLQCPGHKCDAHVDEATILALVPTWYGKLLSQKIDKAIETNPELRWCPSSKCGRVFKASASGAVAKGGSPVSVACSCGGLWCFQCGRKAHWPASCSADKKFQEIAEQILVEMEQKGEDLITSVMVRNCPNCHYPIEKHLGCSFMYCIMCQTAFCWECLTPMSIHQHGCKQTVQSREVELDLVSSGSTHFAEYFSVYCSNKKARSSKAMSHQRQRLRNVDNSLNCYKSINCSSCLYFGEVMEKLLQFGCHTVLRNAAEFKYYAHLTLEGAAKMAILSKSTSKGLKQHMCRLQFIMERIEELSKCDITQLLHNNHLSKLSKFLQLGNDCVYTIGQFLANRQKKYKP